MTGLAFDFSAGFPSGAAVRAAGGRGVITYASGRRPGAGWMLGKPVTATAAEDWRAAGVEVALCYQYGKGPTADWRGPSPAACYDAGARHAEQGRAYAIAAGMPEHGIFAPADDPVKPHEYDGQLAHFLRGWAAADGLERTYLYGNRNAIHWARRDGLAVRWWLHNYDELEDYRSGRLERNTDHSPAPYVGLHQVRNDAYRVGGVGVDLNDVLHDDWGQHPVAGDDPDWDALITPIERTR